MTGEETDRPSIPGRDASARPLPRRFYKEAAIGARDRRFAVLLDGRPARTPRRHELAVTDEALAQDLAAEWAAQGERIDPSDMPLTTLVCTALDAVAGNEAAVAAEIVRYAGSDLLCYRAEGPDRLVAMQAAAWDPLLAWTAGELGAQFSVGHDIAHVPQPAATTQAIAATLAGLDTLALAAVHVLTTLTGSAILAVAILRGRLDLDAAWSAAHVDEDWQIAKWGEDAEAAARRRRRLREARAAARVLGAPRLEGSASA